MLFLNNGKKLENSKTVCFTRGFLKLCGGGPGPLKI